MDLLFFCARCHQKFQEMGEVLEYGKYYPAARIRHIDGREEVRADSWEIKKALCKPCMIAYNASKFDRENNFSCEKPITKTLKEMQEAMNQPTKDV